MEEEETCEKCLTSGGLDERVGWGERVRDGIGEGSGGSSHELYIKVNG